MAQVTNHIACCSEVGLQDVHYLGPPSSLLLLPPFLPSSISAAFHPCLPLSLPPTISASASFNSTSFHLTLFLSLSPSHRWHQVSLKIIKHCQEEGSSSELVTGFLVGLVVGKTLEVTNCFPLPKDLDDTEEESE